MLRGVNDRFYYALRDDGAASDTLYCLNIEYGENEKLKDKETGEAYLMLIAINESIPAPYTGEILALELDPLNDIDVESLHHDNTILDEWEDKMDYIYLIDGRLNLFKLCLHRECENVF